MRALMGGSCTAIEIIFGADKKWRGDKSSAPPRGRGQSWHHLAAAKLLKQH